MDSKKIAKRLRDLRTAKDVTTAQVAIATGISPSAVSMYECGERIPRDEIKMRLAAYYDVTVESIFFAD